MNIVRKSLCLLLFYIGVISAVQAQQPVNAIHIGTAKIYGKVTSLIVPVNQLKFVVSMQSLFKSMEEGRLVYSTPVKADGSFELNVPMETLQQIGGIALEDDSNYYAASTIGLSQQKPLQVSITLSKDHETVSVTGGMDFSKDDINNFGNILGNFLEGAPVDSADFSLPHDEYIHKIMTELLPQRIAHAMGNERISEANTPYLVQICNLMYLGAYALSYEEKARQRYKLNIQNPPLSFYPFMKKLDLQSSRLLAEGTVVYDFCKKCLEVPAFKIPSIKTMPTKNWIMSVSNNMAPATGFSTGTFYDLLAMTAYASQMNEKAESLSNLQKQFIQSYFTDDKKDIATTLLNLNTELEKNLSDNSHIETVPEGEKGQLLQNILAKYPGKAVVIDFWNTWCMPCMEAHKIMAKIKQKIRENNIAFIYLANESSPKALWENKIKLISGEHYYMSSKKYADLLKLYKADGIPFYLIFNKQHKLVHQSVSFPGIETIQKWLMEALH